MSIPQVPAKLAPEVEADLRLVEGLRRVVRGDLWEGVPLDLAVHWFVNILRHQGKLTSGGCRSGAVLREVALAMAFPHLWLYRCRGRRSLTPMARRDRIWISIGGQQVRLRRLLEPAARALGAERCLMVAAGRSQPGGLLAGLPLVVLNEQPAAWVATRCWLLARWPRWLEDLRGLCVEMGFSPAARWWLAASLAEQVGRVDQVHRMFDRYSPRAAVVEWDRSPIGAALCAVLASRGIPTFTLVHGAFGAQNYAGFLPLAARYVLTWGKTQSDILERAGVSPDRLIPVGVFEPRPVRHRLDDGERAARLRELGADVGKTVVVVGLTCLAAAERPVWARLLRELGHRLSRHVILVRLHPSNERGQFAGLVPESPHLRLVNDRNLAVQETLEIADVVVVDSSSFGFDTVQRSVPVVVIEPPNGSHYFSLMLEVMQEGAALYARDAAELAAHIERLTRDAAVRARLLERARAFEARYVCAYGQAALERFEAALETVLPERRES